jgi:hypothetical protein
MSFYPGGLGGGKLVSTREVSELAGEQAVDGLFGLAPEEFVAARDELARRLRREGDPAAAAEVKALRRPPLSAWAVNQLAHGRAGELEQLLAAGERLRAAHQAALAGGGAAKLREAARAEREAVTRLVGASLEVLRQAGHPATDATRDRVAATLHAAAADPAAADLVRRGRLTHDLDPSGFGALSADDAEAGQEAAGAARNPRRRGAGTGPGRGRRQRTKAGAADREDRGTAAAKEDDLAAARARRTAAVAARDDARKRARRAADQAVLATRQAERLGRMADQAEREAGRARATATAAKELREAEDRIPTDR